MVKILMAAAVFALAFTFASSMGIDIITDAYGANKDICGIQLCSDIEGGYDAWIASMSDDSSSAGGDYEDIATIAIPLHKGYYDGQSIYYIITDASEPVHVDVISESQGWDVTHSPSLVETPSDARSTTYMFTNGIRGSGVHGFQSEVFTSTPAHTDSYSPLAGHIHVTWAKDVTPKILDSERAILVAAERGDVVLTEIDVVINMPRFIVTPAQAEMLDRMPERMLVIPLHYGFYNGEKVYGLILDSSDKTHSDLISLLQGMNSNYTPSLATVDEPTGAEHTSKVYFFTNGLEGPGVHGFQRQVYSSAPDSETYSPISIHAHVTWTSDATPTILMSESEILDAADAGDVILTDIPIAINMPLFVLDAKQIMALPGNFAPFGDETIMDSDDGTADTDVMTPPSSDNDDSADMGDTVLDDQDGHSETPSPSKDGQHADDSVDKKDVMGDEPTVVDTVPELRLARASVPVDIPMHKGYYDGNDVYYIITDSSDSFHADLISSSQNWTVEMSPFLTHAPDSSLSTAYMFTNGIKGGGIHGYQAEVFTSTPEQSGTYSALTAHMHVTWADGSTPRILDSESAIIEAAGLGEIALEDIDVVINMPQIIWPGGQMMIKDDLSINDETPYGGGQIVEIDTDDMAVTFVAHRGWGPDGRTIYYIVTDATPSGPANMMGVVTADTAADLIVSAAAVDLYQFANGIKGPGPLGFQPGIASSALGDLGYSPMWRIYLVEWNDPADAQLLQTVDDIQAYLDAELITITLARPMNANHIVNCPFIDPFQ